MSTKPKYKLAGRMLVPSSYSGPWAVDMVWAYRWIEVDSNGEPIHNNLSSYWVVDLFWRGLTQRPHGESVPEHLKYKGTCQVTSGCLMNGVHDGPCHVVGMC